MPARKMNVESHTAPTKRASGDYYGTGVRNKMGRIRYWSMNDAAVPHKDLSKKPRSLA